jgi:rubrerythrin
MEHAYSPVLSNLAKACEKQHRPREAELFWALSDYYDTSADPDSQAGFSDLAKDFADDDSSYLTPIREAATLAADRGALRMATWGGKVNAIQKSAVERYVKKGDELLEGKSLFVCAACGFIFIGETAPDICPVCKAPAPRFIKSS